MDNLTGSIRQAAASGDYLKAGRLWTEYMSQLLQEVRTGSLSRGQLDEARKLMEWCRLTATLARSHLQDRLDRLQIASCYDAAPSSPSPRILQRRL